MTDETNYWHIDKRIPVAVVVVLLLQLGTVVWCAGTIATKVNNHDQRLDNLERNVNAMIEIKARLDVLSTQMAEGRQTFQTQLDDLKKSLSDIRRSRRG